MDLPGHGDSPTQPPLPVVTWDNREALWGSVADVAAAFKAEEPRQAPCVRRPYVYVTSWQCLDWTLTTVELTIFLLFFPSLLAVGHSMGAVSRVALGGGVEGRGLRVCAFAPSHRATVPQSKIRVARDTRIHGNVQTYTPPALNRCRRQSSSPSSTPLASFPAASCVSSRSWPRQPPRAPRARTCRCTTRLWLRRRCEGASRGRVVGSGRNVSCCCCCGGRARGGRSEIDSFLFSFLFFSFLFFSFLFFQDLPSIVSISPHLKRQRRKL